MFINGTFFTHLEKCWLQCSDRKAVKDTQHNVTNFISPVLPVAQLYLLLFMRIINIAIYKAQSLVFLPGFITFCLWNSAWLLLAAGFKGLFFISVTRETLDCGVNLFSSRSWQVRFFFEYSFSSQTVHQPQWLHTHNVFGCLFFIMLMWPSMVDLPWIKI